MSSSTCASVTRIAFFSKAQPQLVAVKSKCSNYRNTFENLNKADGLCIKVARTKRFPGNFVFCFEWDFIDFVENLGYKGCPRWRCSKVAWNKVAGFIITTNYNFISYHHNFGSWRNYSLNELFCRWFKMTKNNSNIIKAIHNKTCQIIFDKIHEMSSTNGGRRTKKMAQ